MTELLHNMAEITLNFYPTEIKAAAPNEVILRLLDNVRKLFSNSEEVFWAESVYTFYHHWPGVLRCENGQVFKWSAAHTVLYLLFTRPLPPGC